MKIRLEHYATGSVITLLSNNLQHLGSVIYHRKIHRYESESDYRTLTTELQTYGDGAAFEVFKYLQAARRS